MGMHSLPSPSLYSKQQQQQQKVEHILFPHPKIPQPANFRNNTFCLLRGTVYSSAPESFKSKSLPCSLTHCCSTRESDPDGPTFFPWYSWRLVPLGCTHALTALILTRSNPQWLIHCKTPHRLGQANCLHFSLFPALLCQLPWAYKSISLL